MVIQNLNKITKCFGIIGGCGAVCCANGCIIQCTSQTTNVVFVGMSADNIIQVVNAVVLEIGVKQAGIFRITAIN